MKLETKGRRIELALMGKEAREKELGREQRRALSSSSSSSSSNKGTAAFEKLRKATQNYEHRRTTGETPRPKATPGIWNATATATATVAVHPLLNCEESRKKRLTEYYNKQLTKKAKFK